MSSKPSSRSLGNTKAVCRASYIHPAIFDYDIDGTTVGLRNQAVRSSRTALSPEEAAVVGLLQRRLLKTA